MFIVRCFQLLLLTTLSAVHAHPHAWINLTSDFVINESSELVEVRQRWIFDVFYSALTLDDLRKQNPDFNLALKDHSNLIVENLMAVNYFSHLSLSGKNTPLGKPYDWQLSSAKIDGDELMILEMRFNVTPTSMLENKIEWSVYDPTYYVSMTHDTVELVRIFNSSSSECEPELIEPNPTDEQVMYAASLDKTQKSTDGLGELFAQRTKVSCY